MINLNYLRVGNQVRLNPASIPIRFVSKTSIFRVMAIGQEDIYVAYDYRNEDNYIGFYVKRNEIIEVINDRERVFLT